MDNTSPVASLTVTRRTDADPEPARPIRLALVNDYEVVLHGLARMLQPFAHRIEVVTLDANATLGFDVDVALVDTFAATPSQARLREDMRRLHRARRVVYYSWTAEPGAVRAVLDAGAHGFLSKQLAAEALVAAVERVHDGERVAEVPEGSDDHLPERDWPGSGVGLTEREAEIVALISQGLSNQEVADACFLSINTVKSYVRSAYQKMGVASRSQAVLWALDHGFRRRVLHLPEPEDAL